MTLAAEPDYGEAVNLVAPDGTYRANMSGPQVTGVRALLMRVLARVTTSRGFLFYALDTGENVLELENSTESNAALSAHAGAYATEAEREQGVLQAVCTIRRDAITPSKVRISLAMTVVGPRVVGLSLIASPGEAAKVLFSGA